jgi:molybdate transport system substrate-binding protein
VAPAGGRRRRGQLPIVAFLAVLTLALVAGACSSGSTASEGELLVSAASSLADAFAEIETAFETAHPAVDVVLNFGGSSVLREQILEGAPADVFASADIANMDLVVAGGGAETSQVFATNELQIAVPIDNPGGVTGLAEFADEELLIGLCAPGVPCGDFANEALGRAGVTAAVDTYEPNVRALLTKIESGDLDAGVVYVTDVASSEAVTGVAIPANVNVTAAYPIAAASGGANPDGAAAFVAFVLSADGQEILDRYGFGAP